MTTSIDNHTATVTSTAAGTFVWYVRANDANDDDTADALRDRVTLNAETLKSDPEHAITLERAKADGTYEPAITLSSKAVTIGTATVYAIDGAWFDLNENGILDAEVESATGYAHDDLDLEGNAMISTGNSGVDFAFSTFPDGFQEDVDLGYKKGYLPAEKNAGDFYRGHLHDGVFDVNGDGQADSMHSYVVYKGYHDDIKMVSVPDYHARQLFISAQKGN